MELNNEQNENYMSTYASANNDFLFHELTPEEIAERKKAHDLEIKKNGFLPRNEDYDETTSSPQEEVETHPTRYIIQECIPACKELWSKNIYTFMTSDHLNIGICWIEIISDCLSEENKKIYSDFTEEEAIKFSYHQGTINFGVQCVGIEAQARLLELAQRFQMQDVPKNQAYISIERFLMDYCHCYNEVPNPQYRHMVLPWETNLSLDEMVEYLQKYDDWSNSIESSETIRVFAPEKVTNSISELATKHDMILEKDRVYLSPFHYKKHKKYLEYKQKQALQNDDTPKLG